MRLFIRTILRPDGTRVDQRAARMMLEIAMPLRVQYPGTKRSQVSGYRVLRSSLTRKPPKADRWGRDADLELLSIITLVAHNPRMLQKCRPRV